MIKKMRKMTKTGQARCPSTNNDEEDNDDDDDDDNDNDDDDDTDCDRVEVACSGRM